MQPSWVWPWLHFNIKVKCRRQPSRISVFFIIFQSLKLFWFEHFDAIRSDTPDIKIGRNACLRKVNSESDINGVGRDSETWLKCGGWGLRGDSWQTKLSEFPWHDQTTTLPPPPHTLANVIRWSFCTSGAEPRGRTPSYTFAIKTTPRIYYLLKMRFVFRFLVYHVYKWQGPVLMLTECQFNVQRIVVASCSFNVHTAFQHQKQITNTCGSILWFHKWSKFCKRKRFLSIVWKVILYFQALIYEWI